MPPSYRIVNAANFPNACIVAVDYADRDGRLHLVSVDHAPQSIKIAVHLQVTSAHIDRFMLRDGKIVDFLSHDNSSSTDHDLLLRSQRFGLCICAARKIAALYATAPVDASFARSFPSAI